MIAVSAWARLFFVPSILPRNSVMHRLPLSIMIVAAIVAASQPLRADDAAARAPDKLADFRRHVNHIIVIYQENWSFDGLYGTFPGATGIANAGAAARQVDMQGQPFAPLPPPINTSRHAPDSHFP